MKLAPPVSVARPAWILSGSYATDASGDVTSTQTVFRR